ncbi:MAG: hypothetical protein DI498_06895 [Paracoccus denitrificans]|nr:MAG: hypothetical protein DI498_06895 [Paracoccus denitrificans]PZO84804.1 MAG: hypothetical protein DI633_06895 [Paracoccus denitrificans]
MLFGFSFPSLSFDLEILNLGLQLAGLIVEYIFGSAVDPLPFLSLRPMTDIRFFERFRLL